MRASFIRNANDGLLYILKEDGTAYPAEIVQGNVLKIREPFENLDNKTEFRLIPFPDVTDGTSTFILKEKLPEIKVKKTPFGNSNGGGGGIRGIDVELNGAVIVTKAKTLDFIGDASQVKNEGNSIAKIIFIPSMTTAERLALSPTTALIVEDTDIDNYFKWSTGSNSWSPL